MRAIYFRTMVPAVVLVLALLLPMAMGAIELEVASTLEQGALLTLRIYANQPLRAAAARLMSADEEIIVAAPAFRLPLAANGIDGHSYNSVWVVLMGIPATLEADIYTLISDIELSSGRVAHRQPIRIAERNFKAEEIALGNTNTALRTSADERKSKEARTLIELVNRFRPNARYHLGSIRLPLRGARESSYFGDQRLYRYTNGGTARAVHYGLDLAAPTGTPIYSPARGRVVFAAPRIITGNSIVIEHLPGLYGLYYHLDSIMINAGQIVASGDQIGTVGSSGLATGAHLHWEIRAAGVPIDPQELLDGPLVDKMAILNSIKLLQ